MITRTLTELDIVGLAGQYNDIPNVGRVLELGAFYEFTKKREKYQYNNNLDQKKKEQKNIFKAILYLFLN
jgi:hypothetical protein